jgi:hypothetical protein
VVGVAVDVGVVVDVVDVVVGVVVDVVVGQGVVELVLDDEVVVEDVPLGEHGSVVGVVLDVLLGVVLLEELVLVGPVRNEAGFTLPPPVSSP